MSEDEIKIHRGLNNVYFDRTKTTFIDGKEGILEYRGYNIHDLAEKSSFEEVSYLLLYGKLPTNSELESFNSALKNSRNIPGEVIDIIKSLIWLNMAPLHPQPIGDFLFYFGKYNLYLNL